MTNTDIRELYLVILGGEYMSMYVVTKNTYDWIIKDFEGVDGATSYLDVPPLNTWQFLLKAYPEIDAECFVTIGSAVNDRCLYMVSDVPPYKHRYDTVKELTDDLRLYSGRIVAEVAGLIY